jgi:CheY-like chemotaxis protein
MGGEKLHLAQDLMWSSSGESFPVELWSSPLIQNDRVARRDPDNTAIHGQALVLIADDNAVNLQMLKRVLFEWGVPSVTALGGLQAFDIFREHSQRSVFFSAAVIDLDMQDLDGLELATFIAASSGSTRIIGMLHSPLDSERPNECKRLGIFTILKPLRRRGFREAWQSEDATTITASTGALPITVTDETLSSARLRILLAEDNVVNQRLISRVLTKMGHTVVVASDGGGRAQGVVSARIRPDRHGYANVGDGRARSDAQNPLERSRHSSSCADRCDYGQRF